MEVPILSACYSLVPVPSWTVTGHTVPLALPEELNNSYSSFEEEQLPADSLMVQQRAVNPARASRATRMPLHPRELHCWSRKLLGTPNGDHIPNLIILLARLIGTHGIHTFRGHNLRTLDVLTVIPFQRVKFPRNTWSKKNSQYYQICLSGHELGFRVTVLGALQGGSANGQGLPFEGNSLLNKKTKKLSHFTPSRTFALPSFFGGIYLETP